MYHSIFFGDKNTWDDWHLVPTSRPVLKPPAKKSKFLDIPGADGGIDLSTSLTGYPLFNNREGSFEFLVMNGYQDWMTLYSTIMEYLHGKTMRLILEDDKNYFYEGTFSVEEWTSSSPRSTISINYNVGPYKWNIAKSTDDWLWDSFNFETGIIKNTIFENINIDSNSWVLKKFDSRLFETAPICPDFIVSSTNGDGMDVRYVNSTLNIDITEHLNDGSNVFPDFIFYGETDYKLYFKGHGIVSIEFRSGRL